MQIPILSGIAADKTSAYRTSYPKNRVPVPKTNGVSNGYSRPADGLIDQGETGGVGRGGINWNSVLYRVQGDELCRVDAAGNAVVLGAVGAGGPVTLDYSFDRLSIASSERLWYWDGATLVQVTDADLGTVLDVVFIGGYFATTDGTSIVVTELNDPLSVNPLKYGSSEADPDPVVGVAELHNELVAFNRHSCEFFQNVGGDLFPFQRIDGADVARGPTGTHAFCHYLDTFAFLGGGRNEPASVWLMGPGQTKQLATAEIDTILQGYSESELADVVVEARVDKGHQHLLIHLPDQCLMYDAAASAAVGDPVWVILHSGLNGQAQYRAQHLVWCYDRWNFSDPTTSRIGYLTTEVSSHMGELIGWEFGTLVLYNEGSGAIIHSLELVGLPGRVALGADPVIWTSWSVDGETWSQERSISAGKQGERAKRLQWRGQGSMSHVRMQKFRGTSDCHMSFARLEAGVETLYG